MLHKLPPFDPNSRQGLSFSAIHVRNFPLSTSECFSYPHQKVTQKKMCGQHVATKKKIVAHRAFLSHIKRISNLRGCIYPSHSQCRTAAFVSLSSFLSSHHLSKKKWFEQKPTESQWWKTTHFPRHFPPYDFYSLWESHFLKRTQKNRVMKKKQQG